jgi:predicted DNA-binding transcriptional regulator YafY
MSNVNGITVGATVIFGYVSEKNETTVRKVEVLKVDEKGFFAHCSLRNSARRFLFDRIIEKSVNVLTPAPNPNAAALVTRIGRSLVTIAHNAALDTADSALLMDAIASARTVYRAVATA